jgi:hypothetical protein
MPLKIPHRDEMLFVFLISVKATILALSSARFGPNAAPFPEEAEDFRLGAWCLTGGHGAQAGEDAI